MAKRYFEEFESGDTTTFVGRTISESDIYNFAGLAGSYGEMHTNKEFAATTDYGQITAQGPLLLVVLSGFMTKIDWQPEAIAFYGLDDVRFPAPVFVDDTVRLELEVADTTERDRESGIVTFDVELYNQRDELVMRCDWLLLARRDPDR